jgi:hypothetical protein
MRPWQSCSILPGTLDPRDRTKFVEGVVAELDGHAEIDVGLVHRVGALGFARGVNKGRYLVAIPVPARRFDLDPMAVAVHEVVTLSSLWRSAVLPANCSPLEFLQKIYENKNVDLATRMEAAIAALPYKHPKLICVAPTNADANTLKIAVSGGLPPLPGCDNAMPSHVAKITSVPPPIIEPEPEPISDGGSY